MKKTETAVRRCPAVSAAQRVLGGKWKLELLYYIGCRKVRRFGALRRALGEITDSGLAKQLRELERDGFLRRTDYGEQPPRVEYALTTLGESFLPVLEQVRLWAEANLLQAPPEPESRRETAAEDGGENEDG